MDFLIEHQLDIMLFLCGTCGILAVMTVITKALSFKTKIVLSAMEVSAMLLLFFDRISYIYRGDASDLGYLMVRLGNGMVYALSLVIPFLVTRYLSVFLASNAKTEKVPVLLRIADVTFAVGLILVIVSQFTGLYYTFDESNVYTRSSLNVLCYVFPFLMVVLQECTIIRYRKAIKKNLVVSMLVCIALPTVSSVLQIFVYGISLINMTTALVVCVFYTYTLNYLSEAAERAKEREIEFYKKAREKEAAIFKETTEALANAIDAKDKYTRGHSTRVAMYSRMLATKAGLPEQKCEQIYFAGLLHDIGKIGVNLEIINKTGALTDAEYEQIKMHAKIGDRILSSIRQAPFLRVGARSHHERYDGRGYPDGLKGEDIPEIARVIAVADAYDAMTSHRSYRAPLTKERVREEIENGVGTQFDPRFAKIMLQLMDEGFD